jgi:hypothetical protein
MHPVEGKRITQTILFALAAPLAQTSAAKCDPSPAYAFLFRRLGH